MIYLMHGFIASGKTTQAKILETKHSAIRITPDEWMSKIFGQDPPETIYSNKELILLNLLKPIWTKAALNNVSVILDYGFWTSQSRDDITQYLDQQSLDYKWIVINAPITECKIRNSNRNLAGNSINITDGTFDLLLQKFEPIEEHLKS